MKKLILFVLMMVFLVPTLGFTEEGNLWEKAKKETETEQIVSTIVPKIDAPKSFNDLVKKVSTAVVNISTTKRARVRQYNPFRNNDPFDDFFEKFYGGQPQQRRPMHSLGSGFLISKDGQILTNNHVIANADEIVVNLSDGSRYKAKLIGTDEKTDIAIIDIDNKDNRDFPFEGLGDSEKLKIGDWVVAIGNPFGLSQTVTAGIVSAKGRVIGAGPYDNFIQTDASINPGNSGGPLFDMEGNVVGINTAIFAGGQGLGFAIPINMAKKLIPQLREHGKVVDRGWLGVMIQGITPELAKSFGLPEDQQGALIGDVVPNSPAEKAGLKRGDLIIKLNGTDVKDWQHLPGIVATLPPGKEIEIDYIRSGKVESVKVTLERMESGEKIVEKREEGEVSAADKLGLITKTITASDARKLGLKSAKGIFVERVEPASPAEEADIRTGDIILEVNGTGIKDAESYLNALKGLEKGSIVRLLVQRQGATIFIALSLP
jgi:serine protease Do